ncbi:glycosyltransferase family 4 protein [Tautonia plasticadhaerens]|uniref:GDP-mannose-dependent alpha-(1-6)-phosphatidylinositol monomannoside mannosyltransferase n=1 Tax=Tautonia plasticadhaerens TaxID=2527974 RepID=A0A518H7I6_9BACT|nr:glycosyltransferase family 4 protein [Tautonia plasticadhaerens]QDV36751.1 GDP-mannose-dependent alpha-(1-6)-phosphatidylinositol monomannoside mannosyltransferase [Tautonia plasticadhaerens]
MRIAWYTHRYFPCIGGAETYGRAMVRRLVAGGHEVEVLTSDAKDLWYFNDPRRARLDEPAESRVDGALVRRFPVRHLPFQRYAGKLLGYVPHWPTQCRYSSYMPIIPELERARGRTDAVFAVGFPFTNFSYAAWKRAKGSGAPLILTPFLHLATPGDPVNRHYTRPHQVRLLKEADAVVVVTGLEADAVASWGIPRARIVQAGMGFERGEVCGGLGARFREANRISPDRPLIGHLATLDPNKGTNDLVRSVLALNESRPADDPIYLALAGVSSPHFERFAEGLPASTRRWLIRTGPLSAEEKADFFDAIDVFAMPSRTDSFGIVFLEAWANAKPVVAAAAGGVVEVVEHDKTGFLVPFGDVEKLATAIDWLINEPETARRLGEAGRDRVARGASWDDCFETIRDRLGALTGANRRVDSASSGSPGPRAGSATSPRPAA